MRLVIVDYGSGNVHSAQSACAFALGQLGLEGEIVLSKEEKELRRASHIILPGVGAYGDCKKGIEPLIPLLEEEVLGKNKPFLGICVGFQLLSSWGEEGGRIKGLGWLGGVTKKFENSSLKIPHMGWNSLRAMRAHVLWRGIEEGAHFYFVHGYHVMCEEDYVMGRARYGIDFVAAAGRDNIFATQFHPEKSQKAGLRLLANFIEWDGR